MDEPQHTGVFCSACGRDVLPVQRWKPAFHIALAVLTIGLWLPVWLLLALAVPDWRCGTCGAPVEAPAGRGALLSNAARRIAAHFARYWTFAPWSFTWRVTVEQILVGTAAAGAADLIFPWGNVELSMDARRFLISGVIAAPVLETLLFQMLPIEVARCFRAGLWLQVTISTILFGAAHIMVWGPVNGIGAGIAGGFYLAFTYSRWRALSPWTALWTTGLSHALSNGFTLAVLIAIGRV